MTTIIGISGSLRKHSFNSGLLRASVEAVPEGCELTIGTITGIPLYNADVEEAQGVPQVVEDLKNLTDDGVKGQLVKYMSGFAEFVARMKN